MLTMYLAGAIRDNHPEDIEWREDIIRRLGWLIDANQLRIISPLGGKSFNKETGKWTMSGVPSHIQHIVSQDFWSVDKCDIIVFNFLALKDKYPNIGTLTEWGRSTSSAKLRYIIWPEGVNGHKNLDMYAGVHPFITHNMTEMFTSVEACGDFLERHIPVLAGVEPEFQGE